MAYTYEPIQTINVGSTTATVTFSSIPQTYTDLVVTARVTNGVSGGSGSPYVNFNGDTTSSYSYVMINGSGTSTSTVVNGNTATPLITGNFIGVYSTALSTFMFNVHNYTNTNLYKTMISRANTSTAATGNGTVLCIMNWRSLSAVTSMSLSCFDSWASGSVFTLYGIKAA